MNNITNVFDLVSNTIDSDNKILLSDESKLLEEGETSDDQESFCLQPKVIPKLNQKLPVKDDSLEILMPCVEIEDITTGSVSTIVDQQIALFKDKEVIQADNEIKVVIDQPEPKLIDDLGDIKSIPVSNNTPKDPLLKNITCKKEISSTLKALVQENKEENLKESKPIELNSDLQIPEKVLTSNLLPELKILSQEIITKNEELADEAIDIKYLHQVENKLAVENNIPNNQEKILQTTRFTSENLPDKQEIKEDSSNLEKIKIHHKDAHVQLSAQRIKPKILTQELKKDIEAKISSKFDNKIDSLNQNIPTQEEDIGMTYAPKTIAMSNLKEIRNLQNSFIVEDTIHVQKNSPLDLPLNKDFQEQKTKAHLDITHNPRHTDRQFQDSNESQSDHSETLSKGQVSIEDWRGLNGVNGSKEVNNTVFNATKGVDLELISVVIEHIRQMRDTGRPWMRVPLTLENGKQLSMHLNATTNAIDIRFSGDLTDVQDDIAKAWPSLIGHAQKDGVTLNNVQFTQKSA